MALLPENLDFTDRDFDSIRARLIALIRSVFPDWTDFNVANFGNILMELHAHTHDVLGFYQDNQARESRWTQATQRASLLSLVKLIGFEPETATASQVDVTITARDAATGDPPIGQVDFPAGTVVRTSDVSEPVVFRLLALASVAAGADPSTVVATAENAEPQQDQFTSSDQPNQEFQLGATPYLDDSGTITASDGVYVEVDSFLSSMATDRHFTVVVDQNDRALIRFGNGINGKIPTGTLTVDYKTGGGIVNVEPGNVSVIEGQFTDEFGNNVTVSVTNVAKASAGQARQSIAQIRQAAPESLRVLERAVAREDFEIVADAVAGVARSLMLTSDQDTGVAENTGLLFIIPEGGGTPTQTLKDTVEAEFDEEDPDATPHTLTFTLIVSDPVFLDVDVSATIFLEEGADETATAALIRSNLTDFFAVTETDEDGNAIKNEKMDFGFNFKQADGTPSGELAFSTIYNVVRDTVGVRKIGDGGSDFLLNLLAEDVPLSSREFPRLGTVSLVNGDTSQPI